MSVIHITLSPQSRFDRLTLERRGTELICNGDPVDIANFDRNAAGSQWIIEPPVAVADGWSVKILFPIGSHSPRAARFPEVIVVLEDGPIPLPPTDGPAEDAEETLIELRRIIAETQRAPKPAELPRLRMRDLPSGVFFSEDSSPFFERPDFGTAVAHVIAICSLIELEIMRLVVAVYGKDALTTVRTAFQVNPLKKVEGRTNLTKRLAEASGQHAVSSLITEVEKDFGKLKRIRNGFAHGIWGHPGIMNGGSGPSNVLLLADTEDRLVDEAAHVQSISRSREENEFGQKLLGIAMGQTGSTLTDEDQNTLFKLGVSFQTDPRYREAFDLNFNRTLGLRNPDIKVWTEADFSDAVRVANSAHVTVLPKLQRMRLELQGFSAAGAAGADSSSPP